MSTAAVATSEPAHEVNICEHIKDDGFRCGTPAIRGRHFCYYHSRAHSPVRLGSRNYRAPLPETVQSLQLLIMQVTEAIGSGRITDKVAGKLLYAVQLSTNLLKMQKQEKAQNSGAPFKPSVGLSGVVTEPSNELQIPGAPSSASVAQGGDAEEPQLSGARSFPSVGKGRCSTDAPVTEIPASMEEGLTTTEVETPEEEPSTPFASEAEQREFDKIGRDLLTLDQTIDIRKLRDKGSPEESERASRRLAAHHAAHKKLTEAGLLNHYYDRLYGPMPK